MDELQLTKTPEAPEFNNSAGRLLSLLRLLQSNEPYIDAIVKLYGQPKKSPNEVKGRTYIAFMSIVGKTFDEFIVDVETSPKIPDGTRAVIKEGLGELIGCAFPAANHAAPRALQEAEVALLRMAGSMLDVEDVLNESDAETIRASMEELRQELENSDLKKSARTALLELVRLSRNAIDYYTIHGARGFKDAFKKMLSELMEVYLDEGGDVTKTIWWGKAVNHAKIIDVVAAKILQYKPLLKNAAQIFIGSN